MEICVGGELKIVLAEASLSCNITPHVRIRARLKATFCAIATTIDSSKLAEIDRTQVIDKIRNNFQTILIPSNEEPTISGSAQNLCRRLIQSVFFNQMDTSLELLSRKRLRPEKCRNRPWD